MKHRPHIDGLRAIAVLPVLLFHADISFGGGVIPLRLGFGGGYVGVDIFFVISGYLITGLILKDLDAGQFSIVNFWERRVRRILPALAVVVISCLVAGWCLFFPDDYKELGHSAYAQAMLLSNAYFWWNSGYFAAASDVKPLLHTWSLAVEEQFYLVFPFLLMAIYRYSRKSLLRVILFIGVVSFFLSVYGTYKYPSATFYFLPTRAWELLLGAFLAAIPIMRSPTRWPMEILSWSGFLCILYAVFFYQSDTRFPGVAALPPCIGAALIIWANDGLLTSFGQLLATRPVVFVGLISYSLYLWHWPLLVFFKYRVLDPNTITRNQRMGLLLLSFILAVLSWKFVEAPFRKRQVFKSRAQVFTFAGVTTGMLISAGIAIQILQGLPSRIPPEVQRYAEASQDKVLALHRNLSLKDVLNEDFIELGAGDKNQPISVLVWGDSHARAVLPVLDVLCKEHSVRGVGATHVATAPLLGYVCNDPFSVREDSISYSNAIVAFIQKRHISDVIIVAYWDGYDDGTGQFRQDLIATINALRDFGTRIWIMKKVPIPRWNVPKALASVVFYGGNPEELGVTLSEHQAECRRQDHNFEGLAAPGVTFLDPTRFFVDQKGLCRMEEDGQALYWDNSHLTVHGAMLLHPLFEPIFERINKRLVTAGIPR